MELEKCPQILQDKVNDYLTKHEGAKIIHVSISEGLTPYIDKTISQTFYNVGIEYGNLCTSMSFRTCSKPEWSNSEISISSMIYAEIINIAKNCEFIKQSILREV